MKEAQTEPAKDIHNKVTFKEGSVSHQVSYITNSLY